MEAKVKELHAQGKSIADIAKELNVNPKAVAHILK